MDVISNGFDYVVLKKKKLKMGGLSIDLRFFEDCKVAINASTTNLTQRYRSWRAL